MGTTKILQEYVKLLSKWGVGIDDYCFAGEYALKFQGLPLHPGRKHFDFFIDRKKLPWRTKRSEESATPPLQSVYFRDFKNLLKRTHSDPHFHPIPVYSLTPGITFKKIKKNSHLITLDHDRALRIINPIFEMHIMYEIFKAANVRKKWADEKVNRWLRTFSKVSSFARKTNNKSLQWAADRILLAVQRRNISAVTLGASSKIDILTGTSTYSGFVKGRVMIIRGVKDYDKLKSSSIIVMRYTKNEIIKVLSKIRAIITDEGGLTSHAATISREYKIPTIVGTKVGTRVFKDGDLVEVDANKGIVRKIAL